MLYLIAGLDCDYEGFISTIYGRLQTESVSITNVAVLLIGHEGWLESQRIIKMQYCLLQMSFNRLKDRM